MCDHHDAVFYLAVASLISSIIIPIVSGIVTQNIVSDRERKREIRSVLVTTQMSINRLFKSISLYGREFLNNPENSTRSEAYQNLEIARDDVRLSIAQLTLIFGDESESLTNAMKEMVSTGGRSFWSSMQAIAAQKTSLENDGHPASSAEVLVACIEEGRNRLRAPDDAIRKLFARFEKEFRYKIDDCQ